MARRQTYGRIAAFVGDVWEHACPTIRILAPARKAGFEVVRGVEWTPDGVRVHPEKAGLADLVVMQRDFPLDRQAFSRVLDTARQHQKPVVYDLDDLLLDLPLEHPDLRRYEAARFPILQAILEADLVTVASDELASVILPFQPSVVVLRNYLLDDLWQFSPAVTPEDADDGVVTLTYMGGHSHSPDLALLDPVFESLFQRYGRALRLRFLGVKPSDRLSQDERVAWDALGQLEYAKFASDFPSQSADILLAPLLDNRFNRCKSGLKYLEYATVGAPGVFSQLAPYAQVVSHGVNGLLADSTESWIQTLSSLIESPERRLELTARAQADVRENWMLAGHEDQWARAYASLGAGDRPSRGEAALAVVEEIAGWSNGSLPRLNELNHALDEAQRLAQDTSQRLDALESQLQESEQERQQLRQTLQTTQIRLAEKEKEERRLKEQLATATERAQTSLDDAHQARLALETTRRQLEAVTASRGWRMVQAARKIRHALIPRRGFLGNVFGLPGRVWRYWRAHGLLAVVLRVARGRDSGEPAGSGGAPALDAGARVSPKVVPGAPSPSPRISLLLPPEAEGGPKGDQVAAWLDEQTCKDVEIVDLDAASWPGDRMHGKYLVLASSELLETDATELEENLIALESERLAFTLNVSRGAAWPEACIDQQALPGSISELGAGLFLRRDCFQRPGRLDLSAWLESRAVPADVVGRVIHHDTQRSEPASAPECGMKVEGAKISLRGDLVVAGLAGQPSGAIEHETHEVDVVVPPVAIPDSRPTVLMAMPFLAVGGAERVAMDLIRSSADVRFVVLTSEPPAPSLGSLTDSFRALTPYVYTAPDFLAPHLMFSFVRYLISVYQPECFYIANGATWLYDALSTIKASFPDLRIANQVYDYEAGWINRYDHALASCIDAHIGANRRILEAYVDRGVDPDSVYLIEHGVDTQEFDPARYDEAERARLQKVLGLPPERRVITFMGRLHPQKRPMDFVELARRLRNDPTFTFLMVGEGPLESKVDREIERLGLDGTLHRRHFYRPSRDIYAVSDVMVLPSEYEGMPLVLLESFSMQTPAVVTDVGNTRMVMELCQAGVVIDQIGDVSALQAGVQAVLDNPPDGARARAEVMRHFGLDEIAKKYRAALLRP